MPLDLLLKLGIGVLNNFCDTICQLSRFKSIIGMHIMNGQPTDKAEKCTTNTDKVDREIEKLKEKKRQIEQQIQSETDENKRQALEKQLAQVEAELSQKNNDAYRRKNAVVS